VWYDAPVSPITTTAGCHAEVFEALQRAQARDSSAVFAAALDGEEYLLLAARGGATASERVPVCVTNNAAVGQVLDHYFEELRGKLA
jgi:hypothetical protein